MGTLAWSPKVALEGFFSTGSTLPDLAEALLLVATLTEMAQTSLSLSELGAGKVYPLATTLEDGLANNPVCHPIPCPRLQSI